YASDFGDAGTVDWTLSGNYNKTKVTKQGVGPTLTGTNASGGVISGPISLFDRSTISNLEDASPKVKIIASAFYTIDKFSATLRGTLFGKSSNLATPDGGTFYQQDIKTAAVVDLELNYKLLSGLEFSIGANNLFNKRPPIVALIPGTTNYSLVNAGNVLDAPLTFSPYGINGGYYYVRVNFNF
ncbi:MAG: TonB-dependent receptor, partial [Polaromonas sp.]|nr:TonB-dependent receptor [Polaromonas sp.]